MDADGRSVVSGAFQVLRSVGAHGAARLTDVVADTGLPKATARRLLGQLVEVDALHRDGNRYLLGAGMLQLGTQVQPHQRLREAAERPLHQLARHTGMSTWLVGSVSGNPTFLHVDAGSYPLPGQRSVGLPAGTETAAARGMRRGAPSVVLDQDHANGVCCVAAAVSLPGRARATIGLVMPHQQIPPAAVRSAREAARAIEGALAAAP